MIQDPTLRLQTTHAEQRTHRAVAAEHNLGRSLRTPAAPAAKARRSARLPRIRLVHPLRRWSAAGSS